MKILYVTRDFQHPIVPGSRPALPVCFVNQKELVPLPASERIPAAANFERTARAGTRRPSQ